MNCFTCLPWRATARTKTTATMTLMMWRGTMDTDLWSQQSNTAILLLQQTILCSYWLTHLEHDWALSAGCRQSPWHQVIRTLLQLEDGGILRQPSNWEIDINDLALSLVYCSLTSACMRWGCSEEEGTICGPGDSGSWNLVLASNSPKALADKWTEIKWQY